MAQVDLKELQSKLPSSPGLQGKDKYTNTAVLIPLVRLESAWHLLFEQRTDHLPQGGEICFPGGRFDPQQDKNPVATALRETVEELGIKPEKIRILGRLDTLVAPMGVMVESVVATLAIDSPEALVMNRAEVAKVFVIPINFFLSTEPRQYSVRLEVQPFETDDRGEQRLLFPAAELGLPERYTKPWASRRHRIYVYETDEGILWGITAELVKELVSYWPG